MEDLVELRGKVIGGIMCCPKHCSACPYLHEDCDGGEAVKRDALKVLRGMRAEPRIKTLGEVFAPHILEGKYETEEDDGTFHESTYIHSATFDGLEDVEGYGGKKGEEECAVFLEDYGVGRELIVPCNYPLAEYGKEWRCWTDWPTEEQRKAAKWETGNGGPHPSPAAPVPPSPEGKALGEGERE